MFDAVKHKFEPFKNKVWLSSPTMHGPEMEYVTEAYQTNWMSTVGKNIDAVEEELAEKVGVKYAVGLSCGTASLHLAMKLAGEKIYDQPRAGVGALQGHRAFCSDMTFDATINPVAYENGGAVFMIQSLIPGTCLRKHLKKRLKSIPK